MKEFLRAQLERYTQRLAELDFLLSREDIMKDMQGFMALSRERTDVGAVAQRYLQHQQRQADAQAAEGLLSHEDADMLALAATSQPCLPLTCCACTPAAPSAGAGARA